ncbi:hypothetical protein TanjilG_05902 [Lupinus angustifolius]|uniref:Cytosine-specific methyltransferase n=2 Tax=Magnoliopsida TaxID=3398 RepID=A0A4P1RDS7_LUPAN|nr:hypothetical protein TanjilG_05902 [Lupinus angustifolius]
MASKRKTRSSSGAASASSPNSSSVQISSKARKKTNLKGPAAKEVVKEEEKPSVSVLVADGNGNDGEEESSARFLGDPILDEEARQRWPKRYQEKKKQPSRSKSNSDDDEIIQARRHYTQAEVDGSLLFKLYDDAHVKAGEGEDNYICRIVEMFEAVDGSLYFTAQWYYRAKDTVIKNLDYLIEPKRVFFSEIQDDNPLDCLLEKLNIYRLPLNVDLEAKKETIPTCNYYCDSLYLLPYSTFMNLPPESKETVSETSSTLSSEVDASGRSEVNSQQCETFHHKENKKPEFRLLDLYSGCGGMSTGLCLGANLSGVNLVTKWAVDLNQHAIESLKLNHPETEVRNETAENFLSLLKEWEKLCSYFSLVKYTVPHEHNCKEKIKDFVTRGFKSKVLPLPGDVDVICGGPPCQGISGFNRFRNKDNPLEDEKNKQLVVYMDIVQYLQPKFALMENVVDIVKFANGFLGRYALGRLLQMNYQTRLGIMAAGAYGLPQFRLRVFIWGAQPSERLPQFPLPTHDVIVRGVIPCEFEICTVAYNEGHNVQLQKKLLLEDAISDLPPVENNERRDEIPYDKLPQTEFQQLIRLSKSEMLSFSAGSKSSRTQLYDHRPLELNADDYQRVCRIPKKKGGCFRDLPGVRVRPDNKVEWDPDVKRVYLDSGKPLVPDYAMSFVNGTSSKPFARLWWDETVPTVVTRAEPHNQAIMHPEQDRVLTIRENARLQGFPDYYKLCGHVKARYIQVGNAVAVPVARALGYTLGLSFQGSVAATADGPLYKLPEKFPILTERVSSGCLICLILAFGWACAAYVRNREIKRIKNSVQNGNSFVFLCDDIDELEHSNQIKLPKVTVIMPLKGFGEHNLHNWRTQLTSLYGGPLEFLLVVESIEDPAYLPVSRLISEFEGSVDARVVVAGLSTTCSQKIHNQLVGVETMHKDSKYVLFLDDDIRLHPGSIGTLAREMEKNPEIFIQTGYPLDLPSGSLGSYCIYEYHMPCSMGFATGGKTFFLWGGCMMAIFLQMHADDFRQDNCGVVSGLRDGGYSDDMTLAAIAGAHKKLISSPPVAVFPHPLATDLNFGRYWNYLRKQTFVLESYTTKVNQIMNRALFAVHCYLSWGFVAPYFMAMIHVAAALRFYVKGYSLEEITFTSGGLSMASILATCTLAELLSMWNLTRIEVQLCNMLSPEAPPLSLASYNWCLVFIAMLVDNFLYPISAICSYFSQSINWSGIRYYLKDGKISKIERTKRSQDMAPVFTDLGGKHLYGKKGMPTKGSLLSSFTSFSKGLIKWSQPKRHE